MNIDSTVMMLREVFGFAEATPESALDWLNARDELMALLGEVRDALRQKLAGATLTLRRRARDYEVEIAHEGRSWTSTGEELFSTLALAAVAAWRGGA